MAPSTIKWAIGAMKDKASIGLTKVSSSSMVPELDVAIIRATSHGDDPAEEKHISQILFLSSSSTAHITACITAVARRLSKTRDWIVAVKSLMLLHRLLADGDPDFHRQLHQATKPRTATRVLNLSDFCDESHSNSWDESTFVRAYSVYLDQRLQCMLFEARQSQDRGDGGRNSNDREFESYGDTNCRSNFDVNYRDPNWRSPNLKCGEFDSYREMNSRPSSSNYQEPDSNYRGFDPYRVLNPRPPVSNHRDPNLNHREFDSYGDLNSRPPNANNRDSNWQPSNSNHRELDSYDSYVDAPDSQQQPATPLRNMKTERVLERVQQLQLLLDRMLLCRPTGTAKTARMVLVSLYPLVKESFRLYADICEVLSILLDRFFEMGYLDCVKVFKAYSWAAKQIDELISFYGWSKDIGIVRWSEYPDVQRIPDKMLMTLEEFVTDGGRMKPDSPKKEEMENFGEDEGDPIPDSATAIKALPPPENQVEKEEKTENLAKTEQETEADLLNLRENAMSSEEQSNRLALALFSADGSSSNSKNMVSWEAFSSKTEPGLEQEWELALVESTSMLSKQRATLGGELDPLVLNGMYDQGAIKQYTDTQMSKGSASSVMLPAPGKTPVLALPAPDGVIERVGWDPFEASLSIPPPSYVQMADVERKQRMMMMEQQMWEQYRRDGMHGQVGLGVLNANGYYGVGPPVASPYGTRPVHGGGPYYYSPY